ncbi:substrate-binding periplasmic protein [Bdellovibrio svalbardensis]|uniref:substrate-binding periplasmic protein n=1 Tax=Bdellovibrio svalbardensis TaxID=2972972 RepID=UPI0024084FC6|nr:transporter substrate-binding domain-containing protein [Bdellovibrio svalbardensis]
MTISLSSYGGSITYVTDPFPPYIYEKENLPQGSVTKTLPLILGIKPEEITYKFVPWKRALLEIEQGTADIIGPMLVDPKKDYLWFTQPVMAGEVSLWSSVTNKKAKDLNWLKPEDLNGLRLGFILGYFYGEDFEKYLKDPGVQTIHIKDVEQALNMLKKGHIDIFVGLDAVFVDYASKPPFQLKDFKKVGKPVFTGEYTYGISKKSPLAKQLKVINARIAELRKQKAAQ